MKLRNKRIVATQNLMFTNVKRECWDLDYSFIKWLNSHLKVYLKDASTVVDLSFYKFTFEGFEYTLEELIKLLIETTDYLIDHFYDTSECIKVDYDRVLSILGLIHQHLWW